MITLEKSGNALKFTFSGNSLYLQDGVIEAPINSLTLVEDTSGLATFKRSATNDIFLSCPYDELGMTKLELASWFKTNACSTGGGGGGTDTGTVQTMIDESISGKADTTAVTQAISNAVSGYADSVEFDSTTNYVKFYHGGTSGTEVYSFDASSFVIDGMVENVEIINGNLVIEFNTASGKEDIEIPISDIFDANNYYTKAETDAAISAATDDMATKTWVENQNYITGVDLTAYATTEYVDESVSGKADSSSVYTKSEAGSALTEVHIYDARDQYEEELNIKAGTLSSPLNSAYTPTMQSIQLSELKFDGAVLASNVQVGVGTYEYKQYGTANPIYANKIKDAHVFKVSMQDANSSCSFTIFGTCTTDTGATATFTIVLQKDNNTAVFTNDEYSVGTVLSFENNIATVQIASTFVLGKDKPMEFSTEVKRIDKTYVNVEGYNEVTEDIHTYVKDNRTAISGKLDTSAFTAYSGDVNTQISAKQDTLSAGTGISISGNVISATGGEECTVDESYICTNHYQQFVDWSCRMKVEEVIFVYSGDSTAHNVLFQIGTQFSTEFNDWVTLDYDNHTSNFPQEYSGVASVSYSETVGDFIITALNGNYIKYFDAQGQYEIKAVRGTISSGSPCSVISDDLPNIFENIYKTVDESVADTSLYSSTNRINFYVTKTNGGASSTEIKLRELKGDGNVLVPDIKVGTNVSGWTSLVENTQGTCNISNLPNLNKFRITYNYDQEFSDWGTLYSYLQLNVMSDEGAGWGTTINVNFDFNAEKEEWEPKLEVGEILSGEATSVWDENAKTFELEFPFRVNWQDMMYTITPSEFLSNNCKIGTSDLISDFEAYGEIQEPLKQYVQENRAAIATKLDASAYTPTDLSQYYTSAETESAINAAVSGKQDTLSAGTGIDITNNVISATGGGGTTYSAGRGIDITNNTISFNLPISGDTSGNVIIGSRHNTVPYGEYGAFVWGGSKMYTVSANSAKYCSQAGGWGCSALGEYALAIGHSNSASTNFSVALNYKNSTKNDYETALGQFNNSVSASTTFGDSGNTLFSVGNGTGYNARHNAFEVRQNGDIYITSGGTDIKLQDILADIYSKLPNT